MENSHEIHETRLIMTQTYSEPCYTFKIELFPKTIEALTILAPS